MSQTDFVAKLIEKPRLCHRKTVALFVLGIGGTKITQIICDQDVAERSFYLCATLAVFKTPFRVATFRRYMTRIEKLEAARRNLAAAVRLFFEQGDPIAIHTLAAAAQGVIRDVARTRGLAHTSILHDHPDIPADTQKEWIKILNAPRNFFKHADADPNGTLEFDESANETLLLDACLILSEVSDSALSEANVYLGWFTTANPRLHGALSNNQIGDYAVRNGISPQDFDKFRDLCGAKLLIEPTRSRS